MKNKEDASFSALVHKSDRYAFKAVKYASWKGHSVLAIGQNSGEVAGVKNTNKQYH
jgi:hypothetical protein